MPNTEVHSSGAGLKLKENSKVVTHCMPEYIFIFVNEYKHTHTMHCVKDDARVDCSSQVALTNVALYIHMCADCYFTYNLTDYKLPKVYYYYYYYWTNNGRTTTDIEC